MRNKFHEYNQKLLNTEFPLRNLLNEKDSFLYLVSISLLIYLRIKLSYLILIILTVLNRCSRIVI